MGHTFDYNKITNEELRKRKALDDIRFWLGKQFKPMCDVIQDEVKKGTSRRNLEINIEMFLGIQGYPVQVWLDELGAPQATPNTQSGCSTSS